MSEQDALLTLDTATVDALIGIVREAASVEIMPRFRQLSAADIQTKSGPDDLVTVADKAAEKFISERVRDILPAAAIVGEESVADNPELLHNIDKSEWCVIIDPIDGTSNFAHGIAVFGVILAVTYRGQTVFGLLYDPVMDDWIMARHGEGAWFCTTDAPAKALQPLVSLPVEEAHGFVALWLFDKDEQAEILSRYPRFSRISCLRCSCHEYRQMALGHVHFVVSSTPKPWDHAAGVLVLRELGGEGSVGGSNNYRAGSLDAHSLVAGIASVQSDVRKLLFTDQV